MSHAYELAIVVSHSSSGLQIGIDRADTNPPPHAARPADCLRVEPSLALTVNGVPGTITSQGGIDLPLDTEDTCESATGTVALDPLPATADIMLADDSGQLHVTLTSAGAGEYQVTQCDAASCNVF